MRNRKPKLLVPAALVASAASGCCFPGGGHGPCDASYNDSCWPDGGYLCAYGSVPAMDADGGWRVTANGAAECAPLI
jgi:hypothetical protein